MCEKHEKEIVKETDALESGQSSPSPDYEKGPSDQKFQNAKEFIAEWKKNLRVGHAHDDRKGDAPAPGTSARSGWFDDQTKEIGHASGPSQFEFGWIYRRTQTGHLRERTGHRDSVS